MITGTTSPESVLPGSPAVIAQVVESVGSGVGPARTISTAWQAMSLPQWQGSSASSWESFVPREASRVGKAPAAFSQVASALLTYQSAFVSARAEISAAIRDAAAAEQSTAAALEQHRDATRRARNAEPGTPGSVVGAFFDPGAAGLANAQLRAQVAVTRLNSTGDEVATQIRAAAAQPSGEKPGIEWWEQILRFPDTFIWNGVGGQLIDTLVGVWEMLPVHYMFDDWFNGGKPWWEQYGELWGGIIGAIVSDPLGALQAMWLDFIAADHWDEYAGEGTGRVFTNVVMLLAGGIGVVRGIRGLRSLGGASAAQVTRMTSLLKNSSGVTVQGSRVVVNGVDKMSVKELTELYNKSIHNMDADQATLGRFIENDPTSYEQVARANGTAHFNLEGDGWDNARIQYDVTDAQLYEMLNKPFLEEIIRKKTPVEFTADPRARPGSALYKELEYLELHGYEYDPRSSFARYEGN
ncbi:MAG: putative T7SS-secreted protein [Leucobacter sp.]